MKDDATATRGDGAVDVEALTLTTMAVQQTATVVSLSEVGVQEADGDDDEATFAVPSDRDLSDYNV